MKQKLISNWNAIDFSIIWRRAKSWSAHPLLFLKPHCSSLKTRSTESLHRLRITEANTLPGTDNREIPRWFEHSDLFPLLLYNGTISATFQSSGRTSVDQHLSMMSQSHSTIPLCAFNISQEMLSGPLALPFFNLRTASSTSSNWIGLRSIDKLSAASSGSNLVLQLDVEGFRSWLKCSVQRSSSKYVHLEPLVLRCCLSMTSLQQRPLLLVSTLHQTTTSQTCRACGLRDQFLAPAISSPALSEYPTCIAPDPFSKPLKIRLGSVFWRLKLQFWVGSSGDS